jgi:hypothetical protein
MAALQVRWTQVGPVASTVPAVTLVRVATALRVVSAVTAISVPTALIRRLRGSTVAPAGPVEPAV